MVPCYGFFCGERISRVFLLSRLPILMKFPENIIESLVEEVEKMQMLLEMGREKVCVCLSVCLSSFSSIPLPFPLPLSPCAQLGWKNLISTPPRTSGQQCPPSRDR